ncbi:TetR/AcrR family transcriptional regulator [Candidatus Poriferisocius sp.]|uniref:TetR/AcrR family transcriptional regulator n=1 Tax=Candidatus Poriferisocius sp. TaxID=3101276 RepID=UPI003B011BD8
MHSVRRFGHSRMSVSDVARLAGVSRNTIYKYFGNRSNLINAAVEVRIEKFLAAANAELEREGSLPAKLAALMTWIHRRIRAIEAEDPFRQRDTVDDAVLGDPIPVTPARSPERSLQRFAEILEPVLQDAIDSGEIRQIEVAAAADYIARLMMSAGIPSQATPLHDQAAMTRFFEEQLVRGWAPSRT